MTSVSQLLQGVEPAAGTVLNPNQQQRQKVAEDNEQRSRLLGVIMAAQWSILNQGGPQQTVTVTCGVGLGGHPVFQTTPGMEPSHWSQQFQTETNGEVEETGYVSSESS